MSDTDSNSERLLAQYLSHPESAIRPAPPSITPRADRIRERLTPLPERLAAVLISIPDEIKADGLKMDQVWPLCIGQQRNKPTAAAVADALRALGWTRRRFYSDSTPSTTLWFPPAKKEI